MHLGRLIFTVRVVVIVTRGWVVYPPCAVAVIDSMVN